MVWPRKNILAEYTHPVPPRFYVPEARDENRSIQLPQDEAAHLTRVLRLATGDRIRVFNGRGDEWDAQVDEAGKGRVSARLGERVTPAAEARTALTLCIAVLKADKMDDVIRDAVMLGVVAIQPLITARAEYTLATIVRSGRVARWQRIAIASAKQCGRAVVPEIHQPAAIDEVIKRPGDRVMLVEPNAAGPAMPLQAVPPLERVAVFAGPEGGWSEQEVQAARDNGAMLLTLGALTLRADTVPIVSLTALRVWLEDF
jgi:16S rRNA (uracil1498-N3)-methyltransferase